MEQAIPVFLKEGNCVVWIFLQYHKKSNLQMETFEGVYICVYVYIYMVHSAVNSGKFFWVSRYTLLKTTKTKNKSDRN